MTRAPWFAAMLALTAWMHAAVARADTPLVHTVRPGETLASIAEQYYGDPRQERVLVAENGLTSEGGSAIVVGLRLRIPAVGYHLVREGETFAAIATRYYGVPQRAFTLIEANGVSAGAQPDAGAELVIPYPLRHVASQHDSVRSLAKTYFRSLTTGMATIRRFNGIETNRLQRGQIVLVPMETLRLSEAARAGARDAPGGGASDGSVRDRQAEIDRELPVLREHVRRGRYADAVQAANRLIGGGQLSARQVVTIQRELATALVALDREDLAAQAFVALLEQQLDYELDGVKTSPSVLRVFELARHEFSARPAPTPPSPPSPAASPTEPTPTAEVAPPVRVAPKARARSRRRR